MCQVGLPFSLRLEKELVFHENPLTLPDHGTMVLLQAVVMQDLCSQVLDPKPSWTRGAGTFYPSTIGKDMLLIFTD